MRLDGYGLFVRDMPTMVRFYRDVLGFEIKEEEAADNVYLIKDGILFMLYRRSDFEKMTDHTYEYVRGFNGHSEIALYVDTFEEEEEIDIHAVMKEIKELEAKRAELDKEIDVYLKELGLLED